MPKLPKQTDYGFLVSAMGVGPDPILRRVHYASDAVRAAENLRRNGALHVFVFSLDNPSWNGQEQKP